MDKRKYIDLYNKAKNYTRLLAVAGRPYQSREVNEVQSLFFDHLERVARTKLKDGIVRGCDLIYNGKTSVKITEGQLFIGGMILDCEETSLTITGKGKEIIGAKITEEVITSLEDNELRDPAAGFNNFMNEGCDRLKSTVKFVINDPSALLIYSLIDGKIETQEEVVHDNFTDILARRTFDESGNYKITGLDIISKNEGVLDTVNMSLEAGKAYIRGYEVTKPVSTVFQLRKSTGSSSIIGEPKVFTEGSTFEFKLHSPYIKGITRIVVEERVTRQITRGHIQGGIDYLPMKPVMSVESVNGYTRGTDWNLSQEGIDWSPSGREPSSGQSYTVTWTVSKSLTPSDYRVSENGSISTITILNSSNLKPNSIVSVDYEFYYARKDLVCLDSKGNIIITEGQPDTLLQVESPIQNDRNLLRLATVTLFPNSYKTEVVDVSIQNTSMEDLKLMKDRINDIEYNLALSDLDREAIGKESASYLRGVLTDGFVGYSKVDTTHSQSDFSIDFNTRELTLPYTQTTRELVVASNSTTRKTRKFILNPYKEVVVISQPLASSTMLVNPYLSIPKSPTMILTPSTDSWVEESVKTVDGGTTVNTTTSRTWWRERGERWTQVEKIEWNNRMTKTENSTTTSTKTSETKTSVQESDILYMRPKTVSFYAENFIPFQNNLEGWFDGKKITLTPTLGTESGSLGGTVRAKADGTVSGTFQIPNKTLCGSREFQLFSTDENFIASAYYTANGRKRDITKTVYHTIKQTIHTDVYVRERPRIRRERNDRDPLAQTFEFQTDRILTSIDLFFHTKDPSLPIVVQVRNTVNGYPGTEVLAEKVINPSQINTSETASIATRVTFSDPVYCEANTPYCFVVITESKTPRLYIARLKESLIGTQTPVTTQPYIAGVLFSGSNTKTWTAHQDSDLKFNLLCAEFTEDAVIQFNQLTGLSADRFMFTADYFLPKGTSIDWEYSLDGGAYQPVVDYSDKEFTKLVETINLRGRIKATKFVSPTLVQESFNYCSFKNKKKCIYITRNVYHKQGFNHIIQEIDYWAPSGSSILVKYATDTSGTDWKTLPTKSTEDLGDGKTRLTLETTSNIPSPVNNFRCKIELTTNSEVIRPRVSRVLNILSKR